VSAYDVPQADSPSGGNIRIAAFSEVEEILRSKAFIQGAHTESTEFMADSLVMLDGAPHQQRRRLEAPLFDRAAMAYYDKEALGPVIERCIADCRSQPGAHGAVQVDLVPLASTMLHRIAALVIGIDGIDTPERIERFRWFHDRLAEAMQVEWADGDHAEVIARGLRHRSEFTAEMFGPSVRRRQELIARFAAGELGRQDLPEDLLTLLYLHWDPNWDEGVPLRETSLFMLASLQTTAHALPHVVYHLSTWLRDHPEDRARIDDPGFLGLAISESLRLHVPVPSLTHIAAEDVVLSTGRKIVKGDVVAVMFGPANRERDTFGEDADEFRPYREVPPRLRQWGMTFGSGDHTCLGRPLVTGLASRGGEPSKGVDGSMSRMIRALFAAGVRLDPQNPPKMVAGTRHDAYASLPVLLNAL
jgi:cytochrome P450